MVQTRPQDGSIKSTFGDWGNDKTNEIFGTPTHRDDGWAIDEADISSSELNWLFRHAWQWSRWFRENAVEIGELIANDFVIVDGQPPVPASLLEWGSTYTELFIAGIRSEKDAIISASVNASKDTYIGINNANQFEKNEVANGAAEPTPTAGFVHVWKIVSDATDITAVTTVIDTKPKFVDHFAADLVTQRATTSDSESTYSEQVATLRTSATVDTLIVNLGTAALNSGQLIKIFATAYDETDTDSFYTRDAVWHVRRETGGIYNGDGDNPEVAQRDNEASAAAGAGSKVSVKEDTGVLKVFVKNGSALPFKWAVRIEILRTDL